jgi:hypothetical protein
MYIFSFNETNDFGLVISIEDKEYFEEHGCLDDNYPEDDFWELLPDCVSEIMEGAYETSASIEETRIRLVAAGFEESQELFEFIESLAM